MAFKGYAGGVVDLPFEKCGWVSGMHNTFRQHLLTNVRQRKLTVFKLNSGTDKNVTHRLSGHQTYSGVQPNR